MTRALSSIVLAATIAGSLVAHAQDAAVRDGSAFHAKVVSLYSFEPHKLTSEQINAKSKDLDAFWNEVKANPKQFLPLLRVELRDASNSPFFSYDGSKLLLGVSQDQNDRALALEAIPRADLKDLQHTDYLRTVHWFATNNFDTTKAAFRILDYPDFKAFIVQHALTLGQDYSLICMLFPMPDSMFVGPLVDRLKTEQNVVSQKSILLALWYSMTPEAKAALARFIDDASKPQEARDYGRRLAERKAPTAGMATLPSVEQLKMERQNAMRRISDEALIEFDRLTVKLLAK
jgi:hypothetical protein